jgi:hypothetical protein
MVSWAVLVKMRAIAISVTAWLIMATTPAAATSILFIGNSFTFGAASPVMYYRPELVTDLNKEGIGGVPALFKTFTEEAGLNWTVTLETAPGMDLAYHLNKKRQLIDKAWDVVMLQGHSMFDLHHPGDPTNHIAAAKTLAEMFHAANPKVEVNLTSTWSRADQTYRPDGHWTGKSIYQMAEDLEAGNKLALGPGSPVHEVIPVGTAWNRAIRDGIADGNPYDGLEFGKVDLWTWDQYHASAAGYYLEALVIFGAVTHVDPRTLPERETVAIMLGLEPRLAARLRDVAAEQLHLPPRLAPLPVLPPPAPPAAPRR